MKIPKYTAWSYSRLIDWERCPQAFKFKHIDKIPEPPNQHMERGSLIHKAAETCLDKPRSKIPKELKLVTPEINQLRKLHAIGERQWTFQYNFEGAPVGWFDPTAWCRVKVDAIATITYSALGQMRELSPSIDMLSKTAAKRPKPLTRGVWIVDWKTGKFAPERSVDQLDLYTLGGFLTDPAAEFCLATLAYVDHGRVVHSYTDNPPRAKKALTAQWLRRVKPMQADTKFKPKPGAACTWCQHSKKKGGVCRAG